MRAVYNTKSEDPQMLRYQALCKEFFELADVACETECGTEILFNQLKSLRNSTVIQNQSFAVMQNQSNCPTPIGTINTIVRSPIAVKRNGRPRVLRMKSAVEKVAKKKKSVQPNLKTYYNTHVSHLCLITGTIF